MKLTDRQHTPLGSPSVAKGDVIWGQQKRPCGIWTYVYDAEMKKGAMLLEFCASNRYPLKKHFLLQVNDETFSLLPAVDPVYDTKDLWFYERSEKHHNKDSMIMHKVVPDFEAIRQTMSELGYRPPACT